MNDQRLPRGERPVTAHTRATRPRIRTIKPEFATHYKVGRLSISARYLWVVMLTQADDEGRLVADPGQLRLAAFGYDYDMTEAKVSELVAEIAATGLIGVYSVATASKTVRTVPYAWFPSWHDHQCIDRPTPSKLPPPPNLASTRPRRKLGEVSARSRRGLDTEGKGRERKGTERKGGELEGRGDGSPLAPPSGVNVSIEDNGKDDHDSYYNLCLDAERREHPGLGEKELAIRALARLSAMIGRMDRR